MQHIYFCRPSNVALPCGGYHYDCSSKADGDYADLVTNCTSFAVCYSGKLAGYQHCAASELFLAVYIHYTRNKHTTVQ